MDPFNWICSICHCYHRFLRETILWLLSPWHSGKFIAQCGKTKNFLSPKKIFRQINVLVISLVNTLLSRNFCQCRNYSILLQYQDFSQLWWKQCKFISRNIFQVTVIFFYTVQSFVLDFWKWRFNSAIMNSQKKN